MLNVPDEFATIQAAVDAAVAGDLVLIAPGVYNEAVDVVTDEIVIRGLEREGVVLDGEFELDNGIRVLGAKGVAVENLTTQNYTDNGVFFTSADGYRASYVTAYRIGDYGVYAFDSINGQIEHRTELAARTLASTSASAIPCNAVIDNSSPNTTGWAIPARTPAETSPSSTLDVQQQPRWHRAELGQLRALLPAARHDRREHGLFEQQPDTPAIDVAMLAMGNGSWSQGASGTRSNAT